MNKQKNIHIITSILIIVAIFIGIIIIQKNYENTLLKKSEISIKQRAEETSTFIYNQIYTNKTYLKSTGDLLSKVLSNSFYDISNENIMYISNVFNDINSSNNLVTSLYFTDNSTGNIINSTGRMDLKDSKADFRTRNWYKAAKESKDPVISDVYNDINGDKQCITMSYAVYKDNNFIGVVSTDIFLEDMSNYLSNLLDNNSSSLYLLSPTGKVIIYHDKNILGKTLSQNNIHGKEIYIYSSYIYGLNWKIVISPYADILEKDLYNNLFMISLIGFILCCILLITTNYYIDNLYKISTLTGLNTRYKLMHDSKRNCSLSPVYLLFISIKELNSVNIEYGYNITDLFLKNYAELLRKLFDDKANIYSLNEKDFILTFKSTNYKEILDYVNNCLIDLQHCEVIIKNNKVKADAFLAFLELNCNEIKNLNIYLPKIEEVVKELKHGNKSFVSGKLEQFIIDVEGGKEGLIFLQKAIKEDKIVPFFQPLTNIKTHESETYEVLMRIKDEDRYLSPYPYIIMAEKYNLIQAIDLMVLDKALDYKTKIDKEDRLIFAFNMSGRALNDIEYLNKVNSVIDKYGIKHENIVLEITETQNIENLAELIKVINEFKKSNYKFSIDDFGTGFSSIYYLKNIPADYVKIDGSFIKDINAKDENLYLVKSIINMAKAFELKVVAEFVESKEILETLENINVDYAQGYYIGKPSSSI